MNGWSKLEHEAHPYRTRPKDRNGREKDEEEKYDLPHFSKCKEEPSNHMQVSRSAENLLPVWEKVISIVPHPINAFRPGNRVLGHSAGYPNLAMELLTRSRQSSCYSSSLHQALCTPEFAWSYSSCWHIVSIPPSKTRGRNKWLPVG